MVDSKVACGKIDLVSTLHVKNKYFSITFVAGTKEVKELHETSDI